MDLEQFRGLDPEEVAARCGGASSADDGPNPGDAGEQEATVADDEHTEDPSTEVSDAGDSSAPEEGVERRGPQRASELVSLLQQADPTLDDASALQLLQEILNEGREADKLPRVIKSPSEFIPSALEPRVRAYIDANSVGAADADAPTPAPFDQDDPSPLPPNEGDGGDDPDPTGLTEAELEEGEPSVEPTSGVDQYREALRPLLVKAVEAHKAGDREARDQSIAHLAGEIYSQGCLLYKSLQVPADQMEPLLFKTAKRGGQSDLPKSFSRDQLERDPELIQKAWYHRVAVRFTSQVVEGKLTVQEALEEFTWPSEPYFQSRLQKKSSQEGSVPPLPTTDEAQPDAGDEQPADEADADPQPDAQDAEATETGPSPIVVDEVDGRRVVTSGELPSRGSHIVKGGGAKMKPPAKSGDNSSDQPGEPRGKALSAETILANLPEEVVLAVMQEVATDDDPVEHWAFRTPHEQREEADRRLLLEYGQHTAA
jgi:hypothetical protein